MLLFLPASRFDVQPDHFARLPLVLLYLFNPFLLLFIALFCYQTPIQLRDYRTLLATHENLKEGLPPPLSPGPSKRIIWEHMVSVLLVPVLLLVLVGGRLGPYETITRKNSRLSSENVAKRQFSLLALVWCEVSQDLDTLQSGRRPGSFSPGPRGGEYTYSPNLDMTYVHTLPSWPGPRWTSTGWSTFAGPMRRRSGPTPTFSSLPGPKKKSGRWPPWDVADEWPCSATPEKRTWPTTWTCWPPW